LHSVAHYTKKAYFCTVNYTKILLHAPVLAFA